jgi:hypothetical protein
MCRLSMAYLTESVPQESIDRPEPEELLGRWAVAQLLVEMASIISRA